MQIRARIYRSSFGREYDRFHENKPKPLVFNLICTQKRRSRLALDEIKLGDGFQILELRRGGDQLVLCPKSGHIRWQAFTKSIEFAKVYCSSKTHKLLKKQNLYHRTVPIELGVGYHYQI